LGRQGTQYLTTARRDRPRRYAEGNTGAQPATPAIDPQFIKESEVPVTYPSYPSLILDWPAERVLRITMSRGKMNSMDFDLHHDLTDIFTRIDDDRNVNAVILTGAGRAFSAGGDFALVDKVVNDPDFRATMWKDGVRLVRNMLDCAKPVIAAINGAVAGGGLAAAMMCDITIAARSAKIVDGHTRLGVAAGDHAAIIWPLLCGMAKSKYYLMTCDAMNGEEAERIGLVSMCVDDDKVMERALEVATKLAQGAPTAIRWTKYALNNWMRNAWPIFDASMALEQLGMTGPDAKEGLSAWLEKREPKFNPDSAL
jgi:enoyl-CoA hydratase